MELPPHSVGYPRSPVSHVYRATLLVFLWAEASVKSERHEKNQKYVQFV